MSPSQLGLTKKASTKLLARRIEWCLPYQPVSHYDGMIIYSPAGIMTVDGYISHLARLIADNEALLVAARVDRSVFHHSCY